MPIATQRVKAFRCMVASASPGSTICISTSNVPNTPSSPLGMLPIIASWWHRRLTSKPPCSPPLALGEGVKGVASLTHLPDPPVTQASQQRIDDVLEICGGLLKMDFCHRRANVYTAILHANFHCSGVEWTHVEVKSPRGREIIHRWL